MRTVLPKEITTIEEAKVFLTDLYNNKEVYHPEDDAFFIDWPKENVPTHEEKKQLNRLMQDIYELPGNNEMPIDFDPCEFILNLDPEYKAMREKDEADTYNEID